MTSQHTTHYHNSSTVSNIVENTVSTTSENTIVDPFTDNLIQEQINNLSDLRVTEIKPIISQKENVQTDLSLQVWFEKVYDAPPNEYAVNYCGSYHDCPPNPIMNNPANDWNLNNWYNGPYNGTYNGPLKK